MKATVTCDDVFDVLTRGPFPTGSADDEAVELHLAACHDCRQLAEALRPAVELFHEAIEERADALPAYRGRLADIANLSLPLPPRVYWDEEQVQDLPARRPMFAQHRWGRISPESAASLVRFASAALLGMALCLLVWTCSSIVGREPAQWQLADWQSSTELANYSSETLKLGPRTTLALAALRLPAACGEADSLPVGASQEVDQACCTKCHSAAHPGRDCSLVWSAGCESCHLAGPPMRLATQHVSIRQAACRVCHDG